ncbi:hypothetical protein [Nocardioides conyzicola]|uniref:Uncharacterized protein n=1 Tax=Nocardioides conyzicola TaxID=1651781 RepID=A0ABP8Y1M6_9ACTN
MTDGASPLHREIDDELDRLRMSGDRDGDDEPELVPFATRLTILHDAVVASEEREKSR